MLGLVVVRNLDFWFIKRVKPSSSGTNKDSVKFVYKHLYRQWQQLSIEDIRELRGMLRYYG